MGHTEGSVDLARLAGSEPAGVICEIMNDDGTMARYPDLVRFAEQHGLELLSVADVVQYRLQNERLVKAVESAPVELGTGTQWQAHVYETTAERRPFLALVLGEVGPEPTLVRVHTGSVLADVFGVRAPGRVIAPEAVRVIERAGRGVVLFIPGRVDLARDLAFHVGRDVPRAPEEQGVVLREFGLGAQVLADLGLRSLRLLTNRPRRIVGLDAFGLEVVEQVLVTDLEAEQAAGGPPTRTTH